MDIRWHRVQPATLNSLTGSITVLTAASSEEMVSPEESNLNSPPP
jgi:hypothetical protein